MIECVIYYQYIQFENNNKKWLAIV